MEETIDSFKYKTKEDTRCQSTDKPINQLLTEADELKTESVPKYKCFKPLTIMKIIVLIIVEA